LTGGRGVGQGRWQMRRSCILLPVSVIALLAVSCGENREEAERRHRQTRKIVELEDRLREMRDARAEPIKATEADVRQSRALAEAAEDRVGRKEEELAALVRELAEAEREGEAYRKKHVVESGRGGER
jgi:uncharacterized protein YlxW (UPF0749 family)